MNNLKGPTNCCNTIEIILILSNVYLLNFCCLMIAIYRWPLLLSGKTREIFWLICWKSSFLVFEIIIYQEMYKWPFLSSWKLEKVRSLQISESSLNFTCKRSHGGAKMNFDFAHWHLWPKLLSIYYSFTPQENIRINKHFFTCFLQMFAVFFNLDISNLVE